MALLVTRNPSVAQVLEAGSVSSALAHAGTIVHLILLDHYMPGVTGISGIGALRSAFPDASIAIVSASTSHQDVAQARALGAQGFIRKTADSREIDAALSALLRGQSWFPDSVSSGAVRASLSAAMMSRQPHDGDAAAAQTATGLALGSTDASSARAPALTPKQVEVLAYLGDGLSNRGISRRMGISENTVRSHVSALLYHLRAESRAAALVQARKLGLLQ